jgi:hypothetical protein
MEQTAAAVPSVLLLQRLKRQNKKIKQNKK